MLHGDYGILHLDFTAHAARYYWPILLSHATFQLTIISVKPRAYEAQQLFRCSAS